jgi:hypothetical protein
MIAFNAKEGKDTWTEGWQNKQVKPRPGSFLSERSVSFKGDESFQSQQESSRGSTHRSTQSDSSYVEESENEDESSTDDSPKPRRRKSSTSNSRIPAQGESRVKKPIEDESDETGNCYSHPHLQKPVE